MKNIFLILSVLFLGVSCQEKPKGYVIHGEVANLQDGMIYLKSFRNKMFFDFDSTEIKEGKFMFTGEVEMPLLFGLATEDMRYPTQFFVENAEMKVVLDDADGKITVTNSPANDLFLGVIPEVYEAGYHIDSLVARYPNSPVAAFYLYRYFTYQLSLDELKATRGRLSSFLQDLPYVRELDAIIEQLESIQVGRVAPDFTLPDTEGNPVSLSNFRGQYVLVDFWAAWCPHCRQENPNVVSAYEAYKDKNFTIVGVSLDFNKNSWLKAIADDHLTWTQVSDLNYWDSEIPSLYGIRSIPGNVLIDPEGVILANNIMGKELQETLKEVFQ
ncbi:MAG: AhpC/TSA family protein [Tannerellaceae bacterium]|nr:AhpC/TSA family protein [Tannerellaceae bacterium]